MRQISVTALEDHVGQSLGSSPWHEITQADVDTFAAVTRDEQWIHTDPERAAAGPFGTTIVHGYMTLSLVTYLMSRTVEITDVAMGINYGLNRCRFPAPLPVDSEVAAEVTLSDVAVRRDGAKDAMLTVTITARGGERPVCVAETIARFVPW